MGQIGDLSQNELDEAANISVLARRVKFKPLLWSWPRGFPAVVLLFGEEAHSSRNVASLKLMRFAQIKFSKEKLLGKEI